MCIQRISVVAQVGINHRKVEVHDKILVVVGRWLLATWLVKTVKILEYLLKCNLWLRY